MPTGSATTAATRAADTVDHFIPRARSGTHDMCSLRPIHGDACPTCDVRCHDVKVTARRGPAPQPTMEVREAEATEAPGLV